MSGTSALRRDCSISNSGDDDDVCGGLFRNASGDFLFTFTPKLRSLLNSGGGAMVYYYGVYIAWGQ